jgi:hypothetical protein
MRLMRVQRTDGTAAIALDFACVVETGGLIIQVVISSVGLVRIYQDLMASVIHRIVSRVALVKISIR